MGDTGEFRYVRPADFAALEAAAPGERWQQKLLDRQSGGEAVGVVLIRTPAGGGSPEGLHIHPHEQVFYVLEGRMGVEVDGQTFQVTPGSVVVFPKGVPHRNWTADGQPTLHLAINVPAPVPGAKNTTAVS
jgi:quercetin dioxygenase-like cupin family protein